MKGISKIRRSGGYSIMKNNLHTKVRIETDFDFNEKVVINL